MSDDAANQRPAGRQGREAVTFVGFLVSLAHTAAVHFGDRPDPASGGIGAANLPAAQQMIDILGLLEEKTRGNLTPAERELLEGILHDLRMRYIEVSQGRPPDPQRPRIILP